MAIGRRRKSDNVVAMGAADSDIAKRAYEKCLARGGEHGHDVEDWLQAELELRDGNAEASRPPRETVDEEGDAGTVGSGVFF